MVGHALRVDECPCNLHETNEWSIVTIHQLICSGVLGWHSNLQPDLGRAPPPHPTGPPNTTATQVVCQFGEMHFWHNPSSVSGIHYWWVGGACGSSQDSSHSGLASPNHPNSSAAFWVLPISTASLCWDSLISLGPWVKSPREERNTNSFG